MRPRVLPVVAVIAAVMAACSSNPNFHRATLAPRLQPSANVEVVDRAPIGAVLLGTAVIQSSLYQSIDECQAAAMLEAQKAGATHAILRPPRLGTTRDGPRCVAEAYYVAPAR